MAVEDGQTIDLIESIDEYTVINNGKTFTIDLQGKTISKSLDLYSGFVTVKDSGETKGKIASSVYVNGSASTTPYNSFSLDQSAVIEAHYGIILYQNGTDKTKGYGSTINIAGTVKGNVWVMGNIKEGDSVINVTGTVDATGKSDVGIALNGKATVNVKNGATVKSEKNGTGTGIEVRAGTLNVTGGTIEGTGTYSFAANDNGTSSTGVGIAVAQHTTQNDINVNISDGEIKGTKALALANPQMNTEGELSVAVTGGQFKGAEGDVAVLLDASETRVNAFISGGEFSETVDQDYVVEGSMCTTTLKHGNGMYYIVNDVTVTLLAGNDGKGHNGAFMTGKDENDQDITASYITVDVPKGEALTVYENDQPTRAGYAEPILAGYAFDGWTLNGEDYVIAGNTITTPITLIAKYTADTYTVTFDLVGGTYGANGPAVNTGTLDTDNAETGKIVVKDIPYRTLIDGILSKPTKEHYDFKGWQFDTNHPVTAATELNDAAIDNGAVTVYATWEGAKVDIIFSDGLGNALEHVTKNYNTELTSLEFAALAPTKESITATREGYTLDKDNLWTPALPAGNTTVTQTMVYNLNWIKVHTVSFVDEAGTELGIQPQTVNHEAKTTKPADPSKDGATFLGWFDGENAYDFTKPVTDDITLTAKWTYTVTWKNGEATLATEGYAYNAMPAYTGETPTKESTNEKVYTFSGWTPAIAAVTGPMTYTATFTEGTRQYTITFVNDDDTVLQSSEVAYGETPAYNGATPTKVGNEDGVYTFDKWSPEIVAVVGDQTYRATYTSTPAAAMITRNGVTTYYATLPEAVANAEDGDTVQLNPKAAASGVITGNGVMITAANAKKVTIDLNGLEYKVGGELVGSTGTVSQVFHFEKGCDITLKNGTVSSSGTASMLVQNYGDLKLENVALDGTGLAGNRPYTLSNNCGDVVIGNGTTITAKTGGYAFDVCATGYYPEGVTVTVEDGATINGNVQYDVWGTKPEENKATLTINGGVFNGKFEVEEALEEDAVENINAYSGSYSDHVDRNNVAEGLICTTVKGNDGYYHIVEAITVTFDGNDGKFTVDDEEPTEYSDVDVPKGESLETANAIPTNLTREGYTREGWQLKNAAYNTAQPVTVAITLKAKWKVDTITVTFDAVEGGAEFTVQDGLTVDTEDTTKATISGDYGTSIKLPNVTKADKVFLGWKHGDNTELLAYGDMFELPAEDQTMTAQWGDAVAKIGNTNYATLADAMAAAQDDETVVLLKNVAVTSTIGIDNGRNVTFDLAGNTVTSELGTTFDLTKGTLSVVDTAETKGGIEVSGEAFRVTGNTSANETVLNIGDGVNVTSSGDCCVYVRGKATVNTAGNLTSKGAYCTIQGNGNASNNGTVLNITGGSVTHTKDVAIYVPQQNETTVSGGNISGTTAIYYKAGTLNITGGTLKGTGEKKDYTFNNNGCNATGDALVVDNCNYPGGVIDVNISGGTFTSDSGKGIGSYYGNNVEKLAPVNATVNTITVPDDEMWVADAELNFKLVKAVTVTFEMNGADSTAVPEQKIGKGGKATKPEDPTKAGSTFKGWTYTEEEEVKDFSFDTNINADTTLTAKWAMDLTSVTAEDATYTGSVQTPVLTVKAVENAVPETGYTYTIEPANPTDAGEYTVTVTGIGDYAGTADGTFTITAKTVTPTVEVTPATYTYDGTAKEPAVTVKVGDTVIPADEYTVAYTNNTNAGTAATVTVTDKEGGNYSFDAVNQTFTINPKTAWLTWTDTEFIYDKAEHVPVATANGLVGSDTCTVTVTGGQTNAGTYSATATDLSNANYKLPTNVTRGFTISPKEISLTWTPTSFTYSGTAQAPAATVNGVETGDTCQVATYSVDGDNATGEPKTAVNVGAYNITALKLDNGNYKLPANAVQRFNITRATLKVTAVAGQKKTYGENDPVSLSYTVTGADNEAITVELTGALERVAGENAGTYAIRQGTLTANDNYSIIYTSADFTIEPKKVESPAIALVQDSYTYDGTAKTPAVLSVKDGDTLIPATEYTVSYSDNTAAGTATVKIDDVAGGNYIVTGFKTFTITNGDMAVTAEGFSGAYDGHEHAVVVTASIPVNSATVTYSTEENGTYSATNPVYKDVGSYTVYYKVTAENYETFTGHETVEITQREIGLNWADTEFTFDGNAHVPTATATNVVSGESVTVTVTEAQTNAGTYTATAAISETNYKLPASNTTQFTIGKADITPAVKIANDATQAEETSWAYGVAHTASVTGNTGNGDVAYIYTQDGVDNTYMTSMPTDAGTFKVYATVSETANYKGATTAVVSFTIGKTNITPVVSITGWAYGQAANEPSVTPESNPGNGAVTYEYKLKDADDSTYSTAVPAEAGNYTVRATVAETQNYNGGIGTQDFAITDAVARIGENYYPTLEAAVNAAVDGDKVELLKDASGNGIKVPEGKFETGLTVDFGGHTYTVNGTTVGSAGTETQGFQLLKDNKITFQNGAITGSSRETGSLVFLIQNYSDLTLKNMNLSLEGKYYNQYTLSNNNGEIVIEDSTINAPDYSWANLKASDVNSFAFDVCRYASYPSVSVTVTGDSVINGNVEVDAGNGDPKNGMHLLLESGTLNGEIKLTANGAKAIDDSNTNGNTYAAVTEQNTFNHQPAEGYGWKDNGDDTSSLARQFTVTFVVDEATYGTQPVFAGDKATEPDPAPEKDGMFLTGWFVDDAETAFDFTMPINGNITLTARFGEAVAKIGDTVYESLEEAVNAAVDGDKVELLKDASGNGIKVSQGKFTEGLTIDFGGHTYTMDGTMVGSTGTETQAFQLLKDNNITFQNGTITSEKAKMLVQNYSNLTLDNMTLTMNNTSYASAYTLSNNNGNTTIKDSTIKANPAGGFAFDVCRYASYPSVSITVTGDSVINGDVELSASSGAPKDGMSLTLNSGRMTGNIVVDSTATTAYLSDPEKMVVRRADPFLNENTPAGYQWIDDVLTKVYTVKFVTGEGASEAPADQIVPIKKTATKPEDPTREGYTFKGWFAENATEAFDFSTIIEKDTTLTAQWLTNVTVTADSLSKVYGKADPTLTFIAKDDEGNDVDKTKLAVTLTRAEGNDVGEYAITASGDEVQGDYKVTYEPGNFTITPAEVTVTANNQTKTYGKADPELTATVTGLVNGEAESLISYTLSREAGEDAGEYAITPVGNAVQGNYAVTYVPGTLTINALTGVVVTIVGNEYAVTYDGKAHTVSGYTATADNALYDLSDIRYTGTARVTETDAGTYSLVLDSSKFSNSNNNFTGVTFNVTAGKLTINKKPVTVVTGSASKAYDGTELTFAEAKITGLVSGQSATATATGTQTEVGNSANNYSIEWANGTKAENYEITEILGTLTVVSSDAQVGLTAPSANKTYDGTALTCNGTEEGKKVTATGLPSGYTVEATASGSQTNVGESANVVNDGYIIKKADGTVVTSSFTNVVKVDGKLTVTAATAEVTITGSTGAGQKPGATTHFSWRNNNMSIYKAFNHQHVPEIRESLKQTQGYLDAAIDFIPYRGDFARGIFATEVVKTDKPIEEIVAGYKEFYKDAKFTHYVDKAIDLKQVVNTNKCLVHVDKYGDKLLITSCIDNLLKGAVGQAVQNMNIMFGLDQTAGLKLKPSAF